MLMAARSSQVFLLTSNAIAAPDEGVVALPSREPISELLALPRNGDRL